MDGNHVAVLDAEIVADHTVEASAVVVQIVVGQNDEHRVLPLLATNKHGIATEQPELVHRVGGEDNGRVVVDDGISNPRCHVSFVADYRRFLSRPTSAGCPFSSS